MEATFAVLYHMHEGMAENFQTLKRAFEQPDHPTLAAIRTSWANIQTDAIRRVEADRDAGRVTDDQFSFIVDWIADWMDHEPEEALEQFMAWVEWVRDTSKPGGGQATCQTA